jgi:hypothetical protein
LFTDPAQGIQHAARNRISTAQFSPHSPKYS